jgi:hypothetical protein
MAAEAQRIFIEKTLLGAFKAAYPAFDVIVNNVEAPNEPSSYVEYSDLAGDALQGELVPGGYTRQVGVLQIDIMVPVGTGPGVLSRAGDWLTKHFSRRSVTLQDNSVLVFRVGSHRFIGTAQQMARQSFRVGYYRDDRKLGSA